jgi:proton-dependent oligopeptide transporter, POT family
MSPNLADVSENAVLCWRWLGGFYEQLRPAAFWAMHAAIAAGGGLLIMLFGRRLSRVLQVG